MTSNQRLDMQNLYLLNLHHSTFLKSQEAHAIGMEMYIRAKHIKTKDELFQFCESYVCGYLLYADVIIIKEIYEATRQKDYNRAEYLAKIFDASKHVIELKKTSRQAGNRLLERLLSVESIPALENWKKSQGEETKRNHYAIIYGLYTAEMEFDLSDVIQSYLYFSLTNLVQHAVRAIPLAPKEAELVIFQMIEKINDATHTAMDLSIEDMANCAIGLEISAMQHKYLLSKLFIS
ncbi:urease accessory protein UreF [Saliterribacillus persicus]|uniref:Urease accessory protein UreF n=1 Tax=Saliterribacillus persicus TaxID=930114 RepID=A0A368YAA5_9BACI|nr:urease accessory UreF family protein [Saliterribacillus persicus]RCW77183.1 urease accessory protein [Saliterribacillus persicus]